jgi:hypothetical protein
MTAAAPPVSSADDPQLDEVGRAALAEVQFLCEQRLSIVRSPDFTEEVLGMYDERLAAHLDALLARGPHVLDCLVTMLSAAAEAGEVCGVAVALLESREPRAIQGLLAALEVAEEEPKLRGLNMALRRGPIDSLVATLQQWLASGSPRQAAAAAEVMAYHSRLDQNSGRLQELCSDTDPLVRRAASRAVALAG